MRADLKATTNRLAALAKLNQNALNPQVVGRVLTDACQALNDIVEDLEPPGRLARGLELLHLRRRAADSEYARIVNDTEFFVEVFIRPESVALLQAGLTLEATAALIGDASRLQALLNDNGGQGEMSIQIPKFRDQVCHLAEALCYGRQADGDSPTWIKRALMVVGGGVIIGVNVGIDATTTAGLLAVVTAISGGVGEALIGEGVAGI